MNMLQSACRLQLLIRMLYMLQSACRLHLMLIRMMYMCLNEICLFFTDFDLNDVYVAVSLQTAFNVDQNDVYVVVRLLTVFNVDQIDVYVTVCLQTASCAYK